MRQAARFVARRHLVNVYEVEAEAGMVLFAGKAVWYLSPLVVRCSLYKSAYLYLYLYQKIWYCPTLSLEFFFSKSQRSNTEAKYIERACVRQCRPCWSEGVRRRGRCWARSRGTPRGRQSSEMNVDSASFSTIPHTSPVPLSALQHAGYT